MKRIVFLAFLAIIFLPTLASAKQKRTFFEGGDWVFIVAQAGETFESISSGLRLEEESLRLWNGADEDCVLSPGDLLKIEKESFGKKKKKPKKKPKKKKKKVKKNKEIQEEEENFSGDEGQTMIALQTKGKGEVLEAIRLANSKTGVRSAFLAGMFHVETGMGGNTGTRHYKKSRMGQTDQKVFLQICRKLRLDPDKTLVSAPQPGQRGGAMGVAQFMPSTWVQYEDRVKQVVGQQPNPWDPEHAAIAMALKVSNDAPGVKSKNPKKRSAAEFDAAKMYLSGTTDSEYNFHARRVLAAAKKYENVF